MRLRLTPLNILVASVLSYFILSIWDKQIASTNNIFYVGMGIIGVMVIVDLCFRRMVVNLKRIWIMQLAFIIFAALILITIAGG